MTTRPWTRLLSNLLLVTADPDPVKLFDRDFDVVPLLSWYPGTFFYHLSCPLLSVHLELVASGVPATSCSQEAPIDGRLNGLS